VRTTDTATYEVVTFYKCICKVPGLNLGRVIGNKVRSHSVTYLVSSDKPWDSTGTYNDAKFLSLQTSLGTILVPTTMPNFCRLRQALGQHRYLQLCQIFVFSHKHWNNTSTYDDTKLLSLQISPETTSVPTTISNFCLFRQVLGQHRYLKWSENFCLLRQTLGQHRYLQRGQTFVSSDKPWDNTSTYNDAKLFSPQTNPGTTPVPTTMPDFCIPILHDKLLVVT
jgi:hypothetical protein